MPTDPLQTIGKRASDLEHTSLFSVSAEVGSMAGQDEGLHVIWKLNRLDNAQPYLTRLGLPKDCGTALYMDFQLREGVTLSDARVAAMDLKDYLTHNLSDELALNTQFRGLFINCFSVDGGGGAGVIRAAITYKRHSSLDAWLSQMLAPYAFADLFTDCSGQLTTSMSLADLLDLSYTSLDEELFGKVRKNLPRLTHCWTLSRAHRCSSAS